ncbi:hypothetical protein [Pseudonocardia sp. ICBG601]|uniref:hypothetical protein n=1 Tax=Pseudonocardia sp. ICBG601 TaxID=2846759 RepID=UPI001CF6AC36|nr:hypothetical protein [Pseudonocardia sp. ICBG601]
MTALVAAVLGALHSMGPGLCPGPWAWAVSAFGVGVGLLPTVGLVFVALLRRRIGSRYGVPESAVLIGTGVLTAGLLPLLAFITTGKVFSTAAAGQPVQGLGRAVESTLSVDRCFTGSAASYLGDGAVAQAFSPGSPLVAAISVVLLLLVPIVASMFVAAQARIVLRRGPRWPGKAFWIPVLPSSSPPRASRPARPDTCGWASSVGALIGVPVVALAGVPSRETVSRSLAAGRPDAPSAATGRPQRPVGPPSAGCRGPPASRPPNRRSAPRPPDARPCRSAGRPRTRRPTARPRRTCRRTGPPAGWCRPRRSGPPRCSRPPPSPPRPVCRRRPPS